MKRDRPLRRPPAVGEDAGAQLVVTRQQADAEEQVYHTLNFEDAANHWEQGGKSLGSGGYCLWLNHGVVHRAAGLEHDWEQARRIGERVLDAYPEVRESRERARREDWAELGLSEG